MTGDGPELFDPYSSELDDDPYPVYRQLRDEHPVYHCAARDVHVLSRHEDVIWAEHDPATFSSARGIGLTEASVGMIPMMINMDPPRHDQLRKLVSRAFTPRRVADLEPRVRAVARELLAGARSRGRFDLLAQVAGVLPAIVIAELLGVPAHDQARFRAWIEPLVRLDPDDPDTAPGPGLMQLGAYLHAIVEERRAAPRDDMISGLLTAEVEGQRLTGEEVLGFCMLLLPAGFETTKNLIGNGAALLAAHPDQRARLARDRSLVPAAIEEMLRVEPPIKSMGRVVTAAVERHGVAIPEGARVLLLYGAANHDDRVFPDPDRFDIDRQPDAQLAFGHGIHYCLGAALARLEGRVAIEELLAVAPEYEVDFAGAPHLHSALVRGYATLPIELSAPQPVGG